jgi:cell division protein FtsI/penicillin-binding protein 2
VEDEQGRVVAKAQPLMVRQVIGEGAAALMVEALKAAVTNGTAARARLDAYTVAGKTGTAQKVENGQYSHKKHYASFIGFLPAEDPQLCISVVMDEPQQGSYGGETAAPVFQRIASRAASYYGLAPSVPEPEPAVAAGGAGKAPVTAMRGRF